MVQETTLMFINSPDFEDEERIPEQYTCDGDGVNPPIEIFNPPEGTQSFVLMMEDLDAPDKSSVVHWLVFNIPSKKLLIERSDDMEECIVAENDFGETSYIAPCPQVGEHRYKFTLYALDSILDLSVQVSKDEILSTIEDSILEVASFIGVYERSDVTDENYFEY